MKVNIRLPKWLWKKHINNTAEEAETKVSDIIKIRCIKIEDENRYILTIGKSRATSTIYTSYEQAEEVLKKFDKDLLEIIPVIVGEMIENINNNKN